jgi:hypothetical protein
LSQWLPLLLPDKLNIMQRDLWFRITVISASILSAVLVVLLIFMK